MEQDIYFMPLGGGQRVGADLQAFRLLPYEYQIKKLYHKVGILIIKQ